MLVMFSNTYFFNIFGYFGIHYCVLYIYTGCPFVRYRLQLVFKYELPYHNRRILRLSFSSFFFFENRNVLKPIPVKCSQYHSFKYSYYCSAAPFYWRSIRTTDTAGVCKKEAKTKRCSNFVVPPTGSKATKNFRQKMRKCRHACGCCRGSVTVRWNVVHNL